MDALDALSTSAGIVQLVDRCTKLHDFGEALDKTKIATGQSYELFELICHIKYLTGLLNWETTRTRTQDNRSGSFDSFLRLVKAAEIDAHNLYENLGSIELLNDARPKKPVAKIAAHDFNASLPTYFEDAVSTQVSTYRLRLTERRKAFDETELVRQQTRYEAQFDSWERKTCQAFLDLWLESELQTQIQSIIPYRRLVNDKLLAVLNFNSDIGLNPQVSVSNDQLKHYATRSNPEQDVVNVRSVHRHVAAGLPAIAAVLTRRNGQRTVLTPPDTVPVLSEAQEETGHIISYAVNIPASEIPVPDKATTHARSAEVIPTIVESNKRDLHQSSRQRSSDESITEEALSYGSVTVGEQSVAHLGNNHINSINIERLIVSVDGEIKSENPKAQPKIVQQPYRSSIDDSNSPRAELFTFDEVESLKNIKLRQPAAVVASICQALYFEEEDYRFLDVKAAHQGTFKWILEQSQDPGPNDFCNWLRSGQECYWVQGKAGSGKSTLMKFILDSARMKTLLNEWAPNVQLVVASFFFWHEGTDLQRSYGGLLRSVLRQIIGQRPQLAQVVFPELYLKLFDASEVPTKTFSLRGLRKAMDIMLNALTDDIKILLLIDGVDEFAGDHFEFCKFLVKIAKFPQIKILVSSRPLPTCFQVFSRYPFLRLQDLTSNDIRDYINSELLQDHLLLEMDRLNPGFVEILTQALIEKASGVFLWIILVVRELLIGLGQFDDAKTLLAKVDKLPNELEKLYDHMFGNMRAEQQREGSRLLQLVYRGTQVNHLGLDALQLFFADENENDFDPPPPDSVPWTSEDESRRVKVIEGRLRSRCCGLAEVQYKRQGAPAPVVNFLHRTVIEYLTQYLVWDKLRELYEIDDKRADKALLAASVKTLRWAKFQHPGSSVTGRDAGLLQACLAYQIHLRSLSDINDESLVQIADSIFFEHCQQARPPGTDRRRRIYNSVYDTFDVFGQSTHLQRPGNENSRFTLRHGDRQNTIDVALFCMAFGGFTKVFKDRLQSMESQDVAASVLFMILSLFHRPAEYLANPNLAECCKLLGRYADPNATVRVVIPEDAAHLRSAAACSFSGSEVSCWSFWLCYIERSKRDERTAWTLVEWQITLALVAANASTQSKNPVMLSRLQYLTELVHYWALRSKNNSDAVNETLDVLSEKLGVAKSSRGTKLKEKMSSKWHPKRLAERFSGSSSPKRGL